MKIMAFGKKMSGELLFEPVEEQEFLRSLKASLTRNAPAMRPVTERITLGVAYRGEMSHQAIDPGDPVQAGWTYIVAKKDPQRNQIIEIIKPLAIRRGMQNPGTPLVYDNVPEDAWGEWLSDQYYSPDLFGRKVPQYVMLAGGPDKLPFRFQSLMDAGINVGRVDFDTLDQLETYIKKIIRLETAAGPAVQKEAVLFATDGGTNDPTYFSRNYMVNPMNDHIKDDLKFQTTALTGSDATKKKLLETLQKSQPALVYTASHGLSMTGSPIDQQKQYNGAICCQANGNFTMSDVFSANDIPKDGPFLEGAAFFQFGCYGYGTPAQSDYSHWYPNIPKINAEASFTAALPKRLLAHPRGPIIFISHLDMAFLHGFTDQNDPYITERWHNRIQPFVHAVNQLLGVQPSGLAMNDMNMKYAYCNIILNNYYDKLRKGTFTWTQETERQFLDTWMIRNDAQNYMVMGDPAARLRIPDGG